MAKGRAAQSIFIAAHPGDHALVRRISTALQDAGAQVVSDLDPLDAGTDLVARIERALDTAEKFVVLITPNTQGSLNWAAEVGFAIGRDAPMIPVVAGNVDHARIPSRLHRLRHVVWREGAEEEAIEQILRATLADAA